MEEWHVGDAAKNPRNDNPELIKPVIGMDAPLGGTFYFPNA